MKAQQVKRFGAPGLAHLPHISLQGMFIDWRSTRVPIRSQLECMGSIENAVLRECTPNKLNSGWKMASSKSIGNSDRRQTGQIAGEIDRLWERTGKHVFKVVV